MNSRHAVFAALVVLLAAGSASAARPPWAGGGKAGKCKEGVNCAVCKNKNKCDECLPGEALKGNKCVPCGEGFVAVRNRCKKCPKHCLKCLTNSKCSPDPDSCAAGYEYDPKSKKCKKPKKVQEPKPDDGDVEEPEEEPEA